VTTGAIVLARTGAARLPNKALIDVEGRPLIWYTLVRLIERWPHRVIAAIPADASEDALADYCAGLGVGVFRGETRDVHRRFLDACRAFGLDAAVRANGDSPLLDPALLVRGVETLRERSLDFVTNLRPRSYPYGVACEAVTTALLERTRDAVTDPVEREHMTSWYYAHLDALRWTNLENPAAGADAARIAAVDVTVDTPEDLAAFRRFVATVGAGRAWADVGYEEALARGGFDAAEAPSEMPPAC